MADEELVETPQRWTARRRAALVLSLLRGETSAAEAARKHGLTVAQVEEWRELFLAGAENGLRSRPRDEEGLKDEQIKQLKQKVGRARPGHRRPEGGHARPPFRPADVRRVSAALPAVSERRACRLLGVARSALHPPPPRPRPAPARDGELARQVADLIQRYPTFGYRRLWALLRRDGVRVNRKTVYRLLRRRGWFVHQRAATPRPRAQGRRSRTDASDVRWAMDVTHVDCGADGWGHLAAVIDCHDRQIVGYEFALRGRAREAERALEQACLARFGTLRPTGATPVLRSDNGLIFQSRRFRAACRDYRLTPGVHHPLHARSRTG